MRRVIQHLAPRAQSSSRAASTYVQGQPDKPIMKTEFPGPQSVEKKARLQKMQTAAPITFFADYEKSIGNYVADADGNMLLDVLMQISSLPLGYNHPNIAEAIKDPKNLTRLTTRPAYGMIPPGDWLDQLNETLMSVAPPGVGGVQTMMCGSCGNEHAYRAAFIHYQTRKRGSAPPTQEEMETCLWNKKPGSPNVAILSFVNGFHGRTAAPLSTTHAKAMHKLDLPTLPWPHAPFPALKYPLEKHREENRTEEQRCLNEVDRIIDEREASGQSIAGIVVEPILSEGGDHEASADFFQQLQAICQKREIVFIVDEVQTGVAITGKMWAHQHWNLPTAPDIMVFAKKMITAGFYYKQHLIPEQGYRIFNTWMGDPHKMVVLKAVLDTIKKDNLVDNMAVQGQYLKERLFSLQEKYSDQMNKVRGTGSFVAFDGASPEARDSIIQRMGSKGVVVAGCGVQAVRLRPACILERTHVDIFMDTLNEVLQET